jgi:hypothetical protein
MGGLADRARAAVWLGCASSARLVGRHLGVVGEDDRAVGQVGPVDGLELADGRGLAVGLVRGFVFEDEQVDGFRGVVRLLPRGVRAGAGLVLGDVADELGDRRLDGVEPSGWMRRTRRSPTRYGGRSSSPCVTERRASRTLPRRSR